MVSLAVREPLLEPSMPHKRPARKNRQGPSMVFRLSPVILVATGIREPHPVILLATGIQTRHSRNGNPGAPPRHSRRSGNPGAPPRHSRRSGNPGAPPRHSRRNGNPEPLLCVMKVVLKRKRRVRSRRPPAENLLPCPCRRIVMAPDSPCGNSHGGFDENQRTLGA